MSKSFVYPDAPRPRRPTLPPLSDLDRSQILTLANVMASIARDHDVSRRLKMHIQAIQYSVRPRAPSERSTLETLT